MTPATPHHRIDNKLFYFFLFILFWAPLPLGSNRDWSLHLLILLLSCVSIYWSALFFAGKTRINQSCKKAWPVSIILVVTSGWAGLQSIIPDASLAPSTSLNHMMLALALMLGFNLCLLLCTSTRRIKLLCYTLVASGLCQAVYGSLMTLTGIEYLFFVPKDSYMGVATGTFVNRNHLAGYLVLTLSLGIGMMIAKLNFTSEQNWRARTKRFLTTLLSSKASLRLILIIMVAGLVMTHSRMGNTAFFASLSITGVLALILHKGSLRSVLILITSLIIIDIFVVGTFFGVDKVAERLSNTSASTETRDEVNSYTLNAINDHMLTGSGAGTFYTDFPKYRDYNVGGIFYAEAHNDYFQFASEYGVPITILLIIAVIICALMAAQAMRTRKDPLLRGLAFGCLMAIIAFAIHSTVDFNLQIPANALTFIVLLACGYIALYKKKSRS